MLQFPPHICTLLKWLPLQRIWSIFDRATSARFSLPRIHLEWCKSFAANTTYLLWHSIVLSALLYDCVIQQNSVRPRCHAIPHNLNLATGYRFAAFRSDVIIVSSSWSNHWEFPRQINSATIRHRRLTTLLRSLRATTPPIPNRRAYHLRVTLETNIEKNQGSARPF